METDLHVAHLMQFFHYHHLPPSLQAVSKPFSELAVQVAAQSSNPETVVALRKLLEAKDAAVRASLAPPMAELRASLAPPMAELRGAATELQTITPEMLQTITTEIGILQRRVASDRKEAKAVLELSWRSLESDLNKLRQEIAALKDPKLPGVA